MVMFFKKIFQALLFASLSLNVFSYTHAATTLPASAREEYWDWKKIERDPDYHKKLSFENKNTDNKFLWGAAISNWQNGPIPNDQSNWRKWEQGKGNIKHGHASQASCDHWNYYREDIKALDAIGFNGLRFSLEWSAIEPVEGEWDEKVIQHYHDELDALLAAGKTPMVTLHHFVLPQWFEERGAFEEEKNIKYFVRFAQKAFAEFQDKVTLWCTVNEPSVYTSQTYIFGAFPPGEVLSLEKAGTVLKHLLQAHVRTYRALKKMPGGDKAQIGIVHQHLLFRPYHDTAFTQPKWQVLGPLHDLLSLPEGTMANFFSLPSVATFEFLRTGNFEFTIDPFLNTCLSLIKSGRTPLTSLQRKISNFLNFAQTASAKELCRSLCPKALSISYEDPEAPQSFDFVGLNYYSQVLLNILADKPAQRDGDLKTDFWYAFYPEGFYKAIVDVAELKVPIYITENGIADNQESSERRAKWIQRYVYTLSRALQEGYDIRGYFYWTLMNNFEWNEGYEPEFGLYKVSWQGKKRILTLCNGTQRLIEIIKSTHEVSLP
jgi:beta-glucosidase